MAKLHSIDANKLAQRFFSGDDATKLVAEEYTREEVISYMRDKLKQVDALVKSMSATQLLYKPAGVPTGPDASGNETHFDTSEIVTHLASGITFHWWGITRAVGDERPKYPKAPERARITGTKGNIMGAGGWSGDSPAQLIELLDDTASRFLTYVETLPEESYKQTTSSFGIFHDMTPHSWLFLDAIHIGMHLQQMQNMRSQPDYPSR